MPLNAIKLRLWQRKFELSQSDYHFIYRLLA
jgi:hypothetical protein